MPAAAALAAPSGADVDPDACARLHVLAARIASGRISLNSLDDLAEATAELDWLLARLGAA